MTPRRQTRRLASGVELGETLPNQRSTAEPSLKNVLSPIQKSSSEAKRRVLSLAEGKVWPEIDNPAIEELATSEAEHAAILRRAVEVIGSEEMALRWMGTPVRALDYATPVSLLHDESGFEAVRAVLGRLEHGVL